MRILIDTNVIISAILYPASIPGKAVAKVLNNHKLVLCSFIIEELHRILSRKFKEKTEYLEEFLKKVTFELVDTPLVIDSTKYPTIRDKGDLPILVSAITAEVDMIITGDKDFMGLGIEKPIVLTPAEFMDVIS